MFNNFDAHGTSMCLRRAFLWPEDAVDLETPPLTSGSGSGAMGIAGSLEITLYCQTPMPAAIRASEFVLPPAEAAHLARHLELEHTRVRSGLASHEFNGPVCALALVYVGQEDLPVAFDTYALTDVVRDEAIARDGEQGLWFLWSPADWNDGSLVSWPSDDSVVDGARRIGRQLRDAGCDDPEAAVALELAHRLARADWAGVIAVSDDFACWASDHEVTEATLDNFRVCAPRSVVRAYEARGWLRFPSDFLLGQ